MKSTNQQNIETQNTKNGLSKFRLISGFIFIFSAIILLVAFTSYLFYWKSDQSQTDLLLDKKVDALNLFGKLGNWLGQIFIFESFGIAAYLFIILLLFFSSLFLKRKLFKTWRTLNHTLFFLCWLPIFIGTIFGTENILSGVYGYQISDFLKSLIGIFGLWLILITSIFFYFILEFKLNSDSFARLKQMFFKEKKSAQSISSEEKFVLNTDKTDTDNINPKDSFKLENQNIKNFEDPNFLPTQMAKPTSDQQPFEVIETPNHTSFKNTKSEPEITYINQEPEILEVTFNDQPNDINLEVNIPTDPKKSDDEIKSEQLVKEYGLYDHRIDLPNYKYPTFDLLKDYGSEEISINKEELEENKIRIVELLKNFNVAISQIKATIGPTVILYEIVPEVGIRVASIKKLQDDIALNLSALGIRIIAPMPGKGTIGIEVPRKNPAMVSMKSVINSQKFQNTEMDLPIVFGKTISNEIFMADLAKMPHLLMAGATGMGKSVGINAILTSLLYKKHPSELKFVMVDPKKVELTLYSKIERHFLAKLPDTEDAIITDTHKVINTLNSLCIEMDTRYDLLKSALCRTLKEYNKKFTERKLNPENGHRFLPFIVLVVDEFADLIMTAGKEIENPIARLAQLARAVGIHLIVATQRPSVNVITGMIKANFPARAAFRVMTGVDSRTILDSTGADQLIGKGDMLYFNGNEILRLQCAFVDTPEIEKIVEFIGSQKGYADAMILPEVPTESGSSSGNSFDANERDALFDEAARIVVNSQQGSTSMLQRQLKLGYNRAGRLMDQLEASGVVGSFNGAKAREVLITDLHYLEQFLENLKK